jgi:hypothetical protein
VLALLFMASNSIAPHVCTVDLYLDGSDWKLDLYETDGVTQVNADVGAVEVSSSAVVALPLDLRALGGDAANELRVHGPGVIYVRPTRPLSSAFPVSACTVVAGETMGMQVEEIVDIDAAVLRVRISWGG